MAILGLGILLTQSRTVCVMWVIVAIILAVQKKEWRRYYLAGLGAAVVMVAAGFLYLSKTGNLTSLTSASTFLGRLLYWQDGVKALISHPLGLGGVGYYYLQPQFQTGVYSVRYIHNIYLQIALDAGIPAAVLFIYLNYSTFRLPGRNRMEKLLLSVILIHGFFDFDLEFLIIWFIILMLWGVDESASVKEYSFNKKAGVPLIGLFLIGSGYLAIGLFMGHIGAYSAAVGMIPFDTDIKISALLDATGTNNQIYWANEILKDTDTIALAYEGKVLEAEQEQDFDAMAANKLKSLQLAKYNHSRYEEYLRVLETVMNHYNAKGDVNKVRSYGQQALKVPEMLTELKNETSPLAYQIKDKPDFSLSEQEKTYLNQLDKVIS